MATKTTKKTTPAATARKTTKPKIEAPMIVKPKVEVPIQPHRPTHEQIARRAFEIFAGRGYTHGLDQQDWLQAERELRLKR